MITIEATLREARGKGNSRKLRREGKIPANILDAGKSTPIELNPKYLPKAYKDNDKKFNLKLGNDEKAVVIKELQIDPVRRTAIHVDLMYIK